MVRPRIERQPRPLAPRLRRFVSRSRSDGGQPFVMPDLSKVPGLIGPVLDLITFYADQFLAIHGVLFNRPVIGFCLRPISFRHGRTARAYPRRGSH